MQHFLQVFSFRLSKLIFAMTLPFCLAKSASWFLLLRVLSLNWIHSKIISGATFRIIGLTKIPKIEFLLLDWIYCSIWINTVYLVTALVGPFLTLFSAIGVETTPLSLYEHHFWYCRQFSVSRSICWLESPDHWQLTNEWMLWRLWTPREWLKEALPGLISSGLRNCSETG